MDLASGSHHASTPRNRAESQPAHLSSRRSRNLRSLTRPLSAPRVDTLTPGLGEERAEPPPRRSYGISICPTRSTAPPLYDEARLAVGGFLARYSGNTRTGYASDLRGWFTWCAQFGLEPFAVLRVHIELYARWMEEERQLARATIGRRLSTVVGFYRFAVIDGLLAESPAEHIRRPKMDTESTTLGLDRMELGTLMAQAAAAGPVDHALACLLGLLGLRVSEACRIDIEHLGSERGHRTVTVLGKTRSWRSSRSRPGWVGPSTWPPASAWEVRFCSPGPASAWTAMAPPTSSAGSLARPGSPSTSRRTP